MNTSLKLETAEKIVAVINELLANAPVLHISVIGDRWPSAKSGEFAKAYTVDYHDGTACVGLSSAGWTMTGAERWHVDAADRLMSHD